MVELAGDVHPAACAGRHGRGAPHRSRRYRVGGARLWMTCGDDWLPTVHVSGVPAPGGRLAAVTGFLSDSAGPAARVGR